MANETIAVRGTLGRGVECPLVKTDDDKVYALAGLPTGFAPGQYVEIVGHLVQISFCMEGEGTIGITSIHRRRNTASGGIHTFDADQGPVEYADERIRECRDEVERANGPVEKAEKIRDCVGDVIEHSVDWVKDKVSKINFM